MPRISVINWKNIALSWGYMDVKQMLLALYQIDGYSIREIATLLNISRETVRKKFKECNINLNQKGGNNKDKWRKISKTLRSVMK